MSDDFRDRTPDFETAIKNRLEKMSDPQPNGCVLYTGQKSAKYGQIEHKRKTYLAHRAAYMVYKGPIPEDMCVCHSCDTPLCVNPDHLWLGTHRENVLDMIGKGRARYAPRKKLSDEEVVAIKQSTEPQTKIATRYGISQSMVSMIRTGVRH